MQEPNESGVVISVDARGARVDVSGETLFCRIRGRFYEDLAGEKRPVAPGDRVDVSRTSPGEGVVEEIHPRTTKLSRPSGPRGDLEQVIAANVDQVAIVVAVKNPVLRPGLIDRIVVAATNHRLEPFVVVNKTDLGMSRKARGVRDIFSALGYDVLLTSARQGDGVAALADRLCGKVTVFSGHSGVGKSSLLNAIDPGLELKTGNVGRQTRKGRHVTTRATLLRMPDGGYVVDTPGVRAFGLWDLERADLDIFFREFEDYIERCRFHNCTHVHEPNCAVREAVESGILDTPRYKAYLRIFDTLES